MTTKEEFLIEHNKLSPANLRVTMKTLVYFREDKPALFKSEDWSIDKIRRPFILWLTSLTKTKKEEINNFKFENVSV